MQPSYMQLMHDRRFNLTFLLRNLIEQMYARIIIVKGKEHESTEDRGTRSVGRGWTFSMQIIYIDDLIHRGLTKISRLRHIPRSQ